MSGVRWLVIRLVRGATWRDHVRSALVLLGVALAVAAGVIGSVVPITTVVQADVVAQRTPQSGELLARQRPFQVAGNTISLNGRTWYQYFVYGAQPSSPLPAGLSAWPAVGHSVISPALAKESGTAIRTTLGSVDKSRLAYPLLSSPDELVSYTSVTRPLEDIDPAHPETVVAFGGPQTTSTGLTTILVEVAMFIIVPACLMLSVVFRLAVASRAKRTDALNLVGVDSRTLGSIYANEMTLFVGLGYIGGILVSNVMLPVIQETGWLGIHWWPNQVAAPMIVYVIVGVILIAVIRALCRHVVRGATKPRNILTKDRQWTGPIGAAMVLTAIGFLGFTVVAASQESGYIPASNSRQVALLGAFMLGILGMALSGRWLISGVANILANASSRSFFLGSRAAQFHAAATGRLVSFLSIVVVIFGLAPGFLGVVQWSAEGDPAHAPISVNLNDLSTAGRAALPAFVASRTAVLTGNAVIDGNEVLVAVGDCSDLKAVAQATANRISNCTGSPQLGDQSPSALSSLHISGLGAVPVSNERLQGAGAWAMILPRSEKSLSWISSLRQGDVTFVASRQDQSFTDTVAGIQNQLGARFVDADMQNSDQYGVFEQQRSLIRACLWVGLLLAILSFGMTCVELRWGARRSTATLAAMGAGSWLMRRSNAVHYALPVVATALPAWALGSLSGLSYMAIGTTPDAMFNANTWAPPAYAVLLTAGVSLAAGWATGGGTYTTEALADR